MTGRKDDGTMKYYKLIGIKLDSLKLQDKNKNIITVLPNEVLYLPSGIFILKKDITKNKIKKIVSNILAYTLTILFILLMLFIYLLEPINGYYGATDGNIHYEWE